MNPPARFLTKFGLPPTRTRPLASPPSPTMASTSAPAPAPPAIVSLASPISENSPQKFEFPPDQPLPFKVTEFCSTDSNPPSTPRPPESTSSTPLSSASVSVVIPSYASKTLLNPFAPHCFSLLLRLSSAFGFRLHIPDPYALFVFSSFNFRVVLVEPDSRNRKTDSPRVLRLEVAFEES